MVVLELLRAEPAATYAGFAADLRRLPWIGTEKEDWARAQEVQGLLVAPGRQMHHQVKIPDLLIAAAAERSGVVVAHYDRDFEAIAGVTGQRVRWIAPASTLI